MKKEPTTLHRKFKLYYPDKNNLFNKSKWFQTWIDVLQKIEKLPHLSRFKIEEHHGKYYGFDGKLKYQLVGETETITKKWKSKK
jgi:hypothetical protein